MTILVNRGVHEGAQALEAEATQPFADFGRDDLAALRTYELCPPSQSSGYDQLMAPSHLGRLRILGSLSALFWAGSTVALGMLFMQGLKHAGTPAFLEVLLVNGISSLVLLMASIAVTTAYLEYKKPTPPQ